MKNTDYLEILKNIESGIADLLLHDQMKLKLHMRRIENHAHTNLPIERMVERLQLSFEYALERKNRRNRDNLTVSYPVNLPIYEKICDIKNLISENQIIIVCGTTGSGKTTQLPKILLDSGYGIKGRIGCTQPRRLAASGMGRRVAKEMLCSYGRQVGCKVRFADDTSDETIIKFMTDGILLAETMHDKFLYQYDAIIIDEAHERSLNIDFILGYLKNLLPKRPDLKIIISSATLDAEGFSKFFDNAPVIQIEGRAYPVEDCFLAPVDDEEELSSHILRALKWISELDNKGDTLVFLPGEREIRDAADLLSGQKWNNTEILPLFGRLSMGEQQKVFKSGSRRRIILATNVAETSITIPGIHYVIDSGLVRLSRYNPRTHVQALQIEQVSQASAKQRRGRCGRIADGICVYLYNKDTLDDAPQYTDPEICRTSLAGVILQMEMLGLPSIDAFPFIDPPQNVLVREGYNTLFEIGALDKNKISESNQIFGLDRKYQTKLDHSSSCNKNRLAYKLTNEGKDISAFPIDPHLAKMICQANREKILPEILVIVSFLSIRDPRERPALKQAAADEAHKQWFDERSDYVSILKLWNFIQKEKAAGASNSYIKKICKQNFINFMRLREWFNLYQDLFETVSNLKWKYEGRKNDIRVFDKIVIRPINKVDGFGEEYELLHKCILSGFPRNIGIKGEDAEKARAQLHTDSTNRDKKQYREKEYLEPNIYIGTKNSKFNIFPGSNLFKESPKWVMTFALVETSKLYARMNAEISPEWLEQIVPGLCRFVYKDIHWDRQRGFVSATETVIFAGLIINSGRCIHYGRVNSEKAREIFIRDAMVSGNINTWGKWLKIHRNMLDKIRTLEVKIRRPESLLDTEAIYEHFNKVLPDFVLSRTTLEQWLKKSRSRIAMHLSDAMMPQLKPIKEDDYPDKLFFYNTPFKLKYNFDPGEETDGITLYCTTDQLSLLPDWALDWLVPEWLTEKIKILIRSLPKQLRIACNPAQQTAEEFSAKVETGKISVEQHLLVALMDFLYEKIGEKISVEDFDFDRLPHYLIMKVAETDDKGKILSITEGLPERMNASSKLSPAVLTMKKWIKTGYQEWPGEALPTEVSLQEANSTLSGYPALVDEKDSVGVQIFMDAQEAEGNHKIGLVRLFRLQYKEQGRYLDKKLPINNRTLLTLGGYYSNSEFKRDFVDNAIFLSLTDNNTISIRDADVFDKSAEETLGNLFNIAEKMGKTLDLIIEEKDAAERILNTITGSEDSIDDIERQITFLFRPGFLKNGIVWERYCRYVKALKIRSERLKYSAAKDYAKMQELLPFQNMLDERFQKISIPDKAYGLMKFACYLQDFRIALFAPELRPFEKISTKRLEQYWDTTLRDRLNIQ